MSIYEKIQEGLNTGVEASRQFLEKAKNTAIDLEETSVKKLDLVSLKQQKKELTNKLGKVAFEAFILNEKKSLTLSSSGVEQIVEKLKTINTKIQEKENTLKNEKTEK